MGCITSTICSTKFFLALLLLSAIPLGILITLETSTPSTHVYHYHSKGWFREAAKWDDLNRRFIVSGIEGTLGVVKVPDDHDVNGGVLEEFTTVKDAELAGNASVGFTIDRPRNRVLVTVADVIGNRYGALAAYDLSSWKRLFLTHLSGPSDEKSLADDVAVDEQGNAYVTDVKASKIWKVSEEGKLLYIIRNPLFIQEQWYKNLVGLNGIVYHPDGYLLVIHTFSGKLFKIDLTKGEEVKLVKIIKGSLVFGDGLELLSSSKIVVAGSNPTAQMVESSDGWETASIIGKFRGPIHRLATAPMVKDGKVYVNHMVGMGYPKKKHAIVEAVFTS